jgi:hypothetical protein
MKRFFIILSVVAVVLYGLFEARRLLEGPRILITSPAGGAAVAEPLVRIAGEAHNIAFLTINDSPAFTDEEGNFELLLTPPAGYTVFTVAATDRFGRSVREEVSITTLNYCPAEQYA